RPDARAFLDGTRRFAQHITPDPGGSALTSGLGGRPSGFDGSTSAHIWAAHIWALIRIIRGGLDPVYPGPAKERGQTCAELGADPTASATNRSPLQCRRPSIPLSFLIFYCGKSIKWP